MAFCSFFAFSPLLCVSLCNAQIAAPQPDSSDDERKESKKKLLHQKCKDEYGLTQEQMLEETKHTESENKESLAALLRIEEERKRIIIRKPPM